MMRLTFAMIFAMSAVGLGAQEPDALEYADSLLSAGDLDMAEEVFSTYLVAHPGSTEAHLGRATARSWSGRFDLALQDYSAVFVASPQDPAALVGSAYAHAWAGRLDEGKRLFGALLEHDPSNFEAKKGLAYAALWEGRPATAVERFEGLAADYPNQSDSHAGLAEALMAARQPERARVAARRAEALAPDRSDLRWIGRAARRAPSPFEVSLTAGRTMFDGGTGADPSPIGIRSVDVSVRPSAALNLYGQYDNGISVDTRALAIGGRSVPTYRLAASGVWGGRLITRVGGGTRSLPGGDRQTLTELDQAVVLGSVGLGAGWTGIFSQGRQEHAVRLGTTIAPSLGWEIAATGHLRAVPDGSNGITGVLTVTRRFHAPIDVTSGVALGRTADTGLAQREVFAHIVARFWAGNGLTLTARRQFGAGVDPFTAVAAGMTVGLGRR